MVCGDTMDIPFMIFSNASDSKNLFVFKQCELVCVFSDFSAVLWELNTNSIDDQSYYSYDLRKTIEHELLYSHRLRNLNLVFDQVELCD